MLNKFRRTVFILSTLLFTTLATTIPITSSAQENQTLRIAIKQETGNLDLLQNVSALSTYSLIFEPLIRYGTDGQLQPALATSWITSDDGLTLSFKLRKNVTFSDGSPFDAQTAKWNLERWMGKPEFSWIGISDAMKSIETNGQYDLVINLSKPVPAALYELTIIRPVRFLSPKAVDARGNQTAPIGTGPWVVTENNNSRTLLTRNKNYWGNTPSFANMELKVVPDELARSNGLRSGDLDIIGGDWASPLSPRRARSMQRDPNVAVVAEPGTTSILLTYSPKSPLLQDKSVREAIDLSLERNAIVAIIYEGYATATANLFPKVIPYSGNRNPLPQRDIQAARTKLEQAGWTRSGNSWIKDGKALELELMVSEEALPGSRRLAEMIQGQLSETGIKVRVSSVDNATIHDRRPVFQYDLTFMATYGAPYDPHGTLANLLLSDVDSGPDGKIYMSPELDPVVRAALNAQGAAREEKMQAIYNWLSENMAVSPLVSPKRLWAHNRRVGSFTLPATDYQMLGSDVTLSD
ncbi:ABC transporter substrate-binding protein [Sansalvadorimonas sp. 2012CJ34-2]|uniref:ABC transporter substrate-binding protein n=1 Tax=Parendozoicomonas callyspongiae TaxID=2942213 RepID=A0ABT0PIX1_9GAMM|nr:ABC transporter substrate-binding protein [Sansalvadorimonas sp. 2012CJ34-2]MCL6271329.1 ABC transporter substrate-binding protein [Sansalvadorimonas sp. 2012CJ34-2]